MQRRVARVTLLLLLLTAMIASSFVLVRMERRSTSSIAAATQGLDEVARVHLWTELGAVARVRWIALGVTAAFLAIGLLALTPIFQVRPLPESAEPPSSTNAEPSSEAAPERPEPPQPGRSADLTSVARLCTDLARVTTMDDLRGLLGRSAAALDASGLILWVGVGDRLLPVMGHGYPAQTASRLGPVTRVDNNAAATAWRTGERVTVSGTHDQTGAVAVPLLGVDVCLGVLAFEVPHGREHDPVTHAVAALIAAQLATVVPRPPAESPAQPSKDGLVEGESQAHSA